MEDLIIHPPTVPNTIVPDFRYQIHLPVCRHPVYLPWYAVIRYIYKKHNFSAKERREDLGGELYYISLLDALTRLYIFGGKQMPTVHCPEKWNLCSKKQKCRGWS